MIDKECTGCKCYKHIGEHSEWKGHNPIHVYECDPAFEFPPLSENLESRYDDIKCQTCGQPAVNDIAGNNYCLKHFKATHNWLDKRRGWARDLQDVRLRLKRFYDGEVRHPRFKALVFEKLERIQKEIYDLGEGQDS